MSVALTNASARESGTAGPTPSEATTTGSGALGDSHSSEVAPVRDAAPDGTTSTASCYDASPYCSASGDWFSLTTGTFAQTDDLIVLAVTTDDEGAVSMGGTAGPGPLGTSDLSAAPTALTWSVISTTNEWDGANHLQYFFYAVYDGTASETVTLSGAPTGTSADSANAILFAYSGVNTAAPIRTSAFASGTSTTPSETVSADVGDTVVGILSVHNPATVTGTSGFTEIGTVSTGGFQSQSYAEYEVATTTSVTADFTIAFGSEAWGVGAIDLECTALCAGSPTPTSPTIDDGQSITLTSHPTGGSGGDTYQWYSGTSATACTGLANEISGATGSTYAASPTTSTYYCYEVTDSASASAISGADEVTVNPALVAGAITPAAPTYDVGQTATLTSHASDGTGAYSYQWYSSATGSGACDLGTLISGATASTYSAPTGSAGSTYYCYAVTDSASTPATANSAWDLVTVDAALVAGAVTPASPMYDVGQTASLTSHPSSGTSPYTYQWYSSTTGTGACASGTEIAGATGASYGASTAAAGTTYYCYVVKDSATTPTTAGSAWDLVTVKAALVAGAVTPASPTYDIGQIATLTSHASEGTGAYSYQWYSSTTGTGACDLGTLVSGATGSTYSAPTGSAGITYYCYVVTDSASTPASAGSTWDLVTVNAALVAGAVTPGAPTYDVGQTATLTSHAAEGTGAYSYQWYSSTTGSGACDLGTLLSGATTATYSASTATAGTTYYCYVVTDSATTPTTAGSAWDLVTVNAALVAGAATPASPEYDVGQAATLTPHASLGTGAYSYQWYSSSDGTGACAAGTSLSGATGSTYVAPTTTAGATYYCYVVTDSATTPVSTGSAWDLVTVNAALVAGAVTPGAPTYDVGQTATLSSHASSGSGAYSYAWYSSTSGTGACDSGTIISGATSATYVAPTGTAGTTYFCYVVKDSATTPTTAGSGWDLVTVNAALTAGALTPASSIYDVGQMATLTSHPASGTGAYSYAWYSSTTGSGACDLGTVISGASGATYGAPTTTVGVTYYCYVVTDSATTPSSVGSAWDRVKVNAALVAGAVTPGGPSYDVGQTATLSSDAASGTGADSYRWYASPSGSGLCSSGTSITGATGSTYSPSTASAGATYYCYVVTDSATTPTSANSAWDLVTVNAALVAGGVTPVSPTIDVDQPATLTSNPSDGTGAYSYQWYSSSSGSGVCSLGTSISGATDATYAAPTSSPGTAYYCYVVTDSATTPASADSGWDLVTVESALVAGGVTPGSPTYDVGQTAALTSNPAYGTPPYSYQWYSSASGSGACSSGTSISGASGASYMAPTAAAGSTYYCYTVTDSETSAGSAWNLVTVNAALVGGGAAPAAPTYDAGQTATLTAQPGFGTAPYSFQWYSSPTGSGSCGSGTPISSATSASYEASTTTVGVDYFCYVVTDSATTPTSADSSWDLLSVNSALVVASPTPGSLTVDQGQTATLTGTSPTTGTSPYSYQWLEEAPGATSYSDASDCTAPTSLSCGFVTSGSTMTGVYSFELEVVDSATTASVVHSSAVAVTVSPALGTPGTPSVTTPIDAGQTEKVTASLAEVTGTGTGSISYFLLVSGTPDGTFADSGAACTSNGTTLTCAYLPSPGTYYFEVAAADQATSAVTTTSSSSPTVTVSSALTAPSAPTVSATALDADQTLTVNGAIPSTGTAAYSWHWLVSVNGAGYTAASECAVESGTGASSRALETCSIGPNTLSVGATYSFELKVADGAATPETSTSAVSSSVSVASGLLAPGAPLVSATKLGTDDGLTVTATIPTTGTAPYQYEWLVSSGSGFGRATICSTPSGRGAAAGAVENCSVAADVLTVGVTYSFELRVNDSASALESQTSTASSGVTVGSVPAGGASAASSSVWEYLLLGLAVIVVAIVLMLAIVRRRRTDRNEPDSREPGSIGSMPPGAPAAAPSLASEPVGSTLEMSAPAPEAPTLVVAPALAVEPVVLAASPSPAPEPSGSPDPLMTPALRPEAVEEPSPSQVTAPAVSETVEPFATAPPEPAVAEEVPSPAPVPPTPVEPIPWEPVPPSGQAQPPSIEPAPSSQSAPSEHQETASEEVPLAESTEAESGTLASPEPHESFAVVLPETTEPTQPMAETPLIETAPAVSEVTPRESVQASPVTPLQSQEPSSPIAEVVPLMEPSTDTSEHMPEPPSSPPEVRPAESRATSPTEPVPPATEDAGGLSSAKSTEFEAPISIPSVEPKAPLPSGETDILSPSASPDAASAETQVPVTEESVVRAQDDGPQWSTAVLDPEINSVETEPMVPSPTIPSVPVDSGVGGPSEEPSAVVSPASEPITTLPPAVVPKIDSPEPASAGSRPLTSNPAPEESLPDVEDLAPPAPLEPKPLFEQPSSVGAESPSAPEMPEAAAPIERPAAALPGPLAGTPPSPGECVGCRRPVVHSHDEMRCEVCHRYFCENCFTQFQENGAELICPGCFLARVVSQRW